MVHYRFLDRKNGLSLAMCMAGALALPLAGCGGDNSVGFYDSNPSMTMSLVGDGETPGGGMVPAPVTSVTPVPQVSSQANASPSQSSQSVYTEFDGEDVRVHVTTHSGHSAWRSSVLHARQSSSVDSRLEDHLEHA